MRNIGSTWQSFTRTELLEYIKGIKREYKKEIKEMKKAIDLDCYDCMGKSYRRCDIPTCSLYPYRPKKMRRKGED